jgi:hypothetical protein
MPQGPGFSLTDHLAVAALTAVALLCSGLVLRPALRRALPTGYALAMICFSLPFVAVWLAAWSKGHYW